MKYILSFLAFFVTQGTLFCQQVTDEEAIAVAIAELKNRYSKDNIKPTNIFYCEKNGNKLLYEIQSDAGESVLVSGNYGCIPILATIKHERKSILSSYDSIPCGLRFMLDWYMEQIEYAFEDPLNTATYETWLAKKRMGSSGSKSNSYVLPLLSTQWGQGVSNDRNDPYAYNYHIQAPLIGECSHSLVGCVPVAMGQLMYFYKHPVLLESYSTQFDWCNMSYTLDTMAPTYYLNKEAISSFLAECARQTVITYGCDGTTSTIVNALMALTGMFKYNEDATVEFQDNHSDAWWIDAMMGHLDRGYPVIYAGATNMIGEDGHAFVCDGYDQQGRFHFNWGWLGQFNHVYCELSHIYIDDINNPFDHWLCAIFDAYPEVGYPELCQATLHLQDYYSVFFSESCNSNYLPYIIVPQGMNTLISASSAAPLSWRTIPAGAAATYQAHEEIVLQDGFTVEAGAEFTAEIVPCPNCESNRGVAGDADGVAADEPAEIMAPSRRTPEPPQPQADLYPNPTSGEVTVSVEGEVQSVVILNMMGQPVGGWGLRAMEPGRVTIDVSPLPAGPYLVCVHTPHGTATKKLLVGAE